MDPDPSEPIPAATLILMRDRAGTAPELLMVERARAMAFAGGALVFPGGRVDPADRVLAELRGGGLEAEDAAARVAAIRETLEETGLAVGHEVADAPRETMRAGLLAGESFAQLLHAKGAALDLTTIMPFARWCPRGMRHRIFDTRFYLARAGEAAAVPSADGGENVRAFWTSARDVLAEADAGRATIIFPTRRNLERLARFGSFDEAVADALAHPVRTITPWVEPRGGVDHLCIPADCGYPVDAERLDLALRA